jgi:hypothetical protein
VIEISQVFRRFFFSALQDPRIPNKIFGYGMISLYLGTPTGHNFSLKRKNKLLGPQTEISV